MVGNENPFIIEQVRKEPDITRKPVEMCNGMCYLQSQRGKEIRYVKGNNTSILIRML